MNKTIMASIIAASLAACESETSQSDPLSAERNASSAAELDEMTPKTILEAVQRLQRVDGSITQTASGTFKIEQNTPFCKLGGTVGIDYDALKEMFAALGQSPNNSSGSGRSYRFDKYDECKKRGAVLTRSFQSDSLELGYEITIAVWQADRAYWIGSIARPDRRHPRVNDMPPPIDGNQLSAVGGSMRMDLREVSFSFVEHVVEGHTK